MYVEKGRLWRNKSVPRWERLLQDGSNLFPVSKVDAFKCKVVHLNCSKEFSG